MDVLKKVKKDLEIFRQKMAKPNKIKIDLRKMIQT